jgi:DNA polymerase
MASTAPIPERLSLQTLRDAADGCRACELWAGATQTVFGAGLKRARMMLVGEQPGDREDLAGMPFVGPAGGVLHRAIADAGLDERELYLTNVVKHFRNQPKGKRRIHQRPEARHIAACRPWLTAELAVVRPEVLVCLGAVAAHALLGPGVKVTADHGHPVESDLADHVTVTAHPSSILRIRDADARHAAYDALVADLRAAKQRGHEG